MRGLLPEINCWQTSQHRKIKLDLLDTRSPRGFGVEKGGWRPEMAGSQPVLLGRTAFDQGLSPKARRQPRLALSVYCETTSYVVKLFPL